MAITVRVGGVDRTRFITGDGQMTWTDQVNGQGDLQLEFCTPTSGPDVWTPLDGQEILVLEDGVRRFGGHLVEPEVTGSPEFDAAYHACSASQFTKVTDRFLVARIYDEHTLDAIVADIVDQDMGAEGISTAGVEPGPTIVKAVFNHVTVTVAFNQLAELTGWSWWIDNDNVLHWRPRSSMVAPFDLTSVGADSLTPTITAGTFRIRPDRQKYRNTQRVRGGQDLTDPRPETLVGDGERRVFATAFPIGAVPTVEVSRAGGPFAEETVGILGVEDGRQWYWNVEQAQVTQDDDGLVLAAPTDPTDTSTGDRVRVTYRGLFPILVEYADPAEVSARAAIEGGSGTYMAIEDHPELTTSVSAIETTLALIQRYGRIGTVVQAGTREPGLAAGQMVRIRVPELGYDKTLLIESVTATVPAGMDEIWYTVRAIEGDPFGGWQEYFRRLLQGGRQIILAREGEILVLVRVLAAGVRCLDDVAIEMAAPESRIGILTIGRGEIGAV